MKIVFLSNYYNHHQAPLCESLYARLGKDFCFIQTTEMGAGRKKMGWSIDSLPSFVRKSYEEPIQCNAIIDEADAVIIGSAPNDLVQKRIQSGKLIIRYTERQLKKGLELWKYPYRYFKWHCQNPKRANVHVLCASAYASSDYALFGLFKGRCYKWGYFPAVKQYSHIDQLLKEKEPASILWVARLIDWKHPELPILVAKRLKDENYTFQMRLIGIGSLEDKIRNMIRQLQLEDCVQLLGAMTPEQVREHMEASQIFLFTSDRNEGWGAVLNEAMNSGCGVIANESIGSVPYLIKNDENGLIYQDGNFNDLYRKVKQLLDDPSKATLLGQQAYETMVSEWNAEIAAERLLNLINDLLEKQDSSRYQEGPCSKA